MSPVRIRRTSSASLDSTLSIPILYLNTSHGHRQKQRRRGTSSNPSVAAKRRNKASGAVTSRLRSRVFHVTAALCCTVRRKLDDVETAACPARRREHRRGLLQGRPPTAQSNENQTHGEGPAHRRPVPIRLSSECAGLHHQYRALDASRYGHLGGQYALGDRRGAAPPDRPADTATGRDRFARQR